MVPHSAVGALRLNGFALFEGREADLRCMATAADGAHIGGCALFLVVPIFLAPEAAKWLGVEWLHWERAVNWDVDPFWDFSLEGAYYSLRVHAGFGTLPHRFLDVWKIEEEVRAHDLVEIGHDGL